ncbi:MAG TPA: hypothetical protein DCL44_00320 [Elusimicrobia bacterium]|nr:hypothetical protein [Elusimicrobiota bacterium]
MGLLSFVTSYRRSVVKLFIPFFFIIGYLVSFQVFNSQWLGYFLLTAMAVMSGCLAFSSLRGREESQVAAWLAFYVLLIFGYAKFYWLILDPSPVQDFFPGSWAWRHFEIPATLFDAFLMQTLGFVGLCLALFVFLGFKKKQKRSDIGLINIRPAFFILFLPFLAGLLLVSSFLVYRYKVGFLGMISNPLPFHLSGLIFYLHTMALPILIITFVYLCATAAGYWRSRIGILVFILWAVSDVLLRSSRASLMLIPLLVLFLALSGGIKIRKFEALSGFGLVFLAVILAPLISSYRIFRLSGLGSFAALESSTASFSPTIAGFLKSVSFIFFRVPGIETSVIVSGFIVQSLGAKAFKVMFSGKGFSWYLGHSAFGLPFDAPNGFATPFIAQWYIAGGYPGIILAGIAVAVFSVAVWDGLMNSKFLTAPVARAFFLLLFFWSLTEGVSPYLVKQTFVLIPVLLIAEFIVRMFFVVPADKG